MSTQSAARSPDARARPLESRHTLLIALVFAAVSMLFLPLPGWTIDCILSLQLAVAVIVLLAAAGANGTEFRGHVIPMTAVPSLLIGTTLFRLSVNLAITRLILAHGHAGTLVDAFGQTAGAGNLVAGVVLVLMLGAAQLLVVARGSERMAEVAARFSLDAMPGEQLAIDADARTRLIDARQAAERRTALRQESHFYGAMDGTMRFVRGDAAVALAIPFIDFAGGLIIGLTVHAMDPYTAASIYLMLAVGHGLAAQIPALFVSAAAALLLARMTSAARAEFGTPEHTGAHGGVVRTVLAPRSLVSVAVLFAGLALLPGWPHAAFAGTASVALALAVWSRRVTPGASSERSAPAGITSFYAVDGPVSAVRAPALQLELSGLLARLLDAGRSDGEFAQALLHRTRCELAARIPVPAPALHVLVLEEPAWHVYLRICGSVVWQTEIAPDQLNAGEARAGLVHGVRHTLERYAFEFVDISSVDHALDDLTRTEPALVRAVASTPAERARVSALVRRLVRERIALPDLADVLRACAESSSVSAAAQPFDAYADHIRTRLARSISAQFAPAGALRVCRLDPYLEDVLRGAVVREEHGAYLALEPDLARDFIERVVRAYADQAASEPEGQTGIPTARATRVLLVSADIRRVTAELLDVGAPNVMVLCAAELRPEIHVSTMAVIGL